MFNHLTCFSDSAEAEVFDTKVITVKEEDLCDSDEEDYKETEEGGVMEVSRNVCKHVVHISPLKCNNHPI